MSVAQLLGKARPSTATESVMQELHSLSVPSRPTLEEHCCRVVKYCLVEVIYALLLLHEQQ